MQSTGHGSIHNSHPVHKSSIILCIRFTDPEIASTGHAVMHFLQPIHSNVTKSISLVHRRDEFRGAPHTEKLMRELVAKGKLQLLTPYVINSIVGKGSVNGVTLKNFDTNEIVEFKADELLFLFGLNKKLGPILDWNIDLNGKKIDVNTSTYSTNLNGVFAVGDINHYEGKLDLILCGFHETTIAVQEAYRRINPGQRVPFGYTTSNSKLQAKLGVNS